MGFNALWRVEPGAGADAKGIGAPFGRRADALSMGARWGVTTRIFWAWILTIPVSAGVSWLCSQALHLPLGA